MGTYKGLLPYIPSNLTSNPNGRSDITNLLKLNPLKTKSFKV